MGIMKVVIPAGGLGTRLTEETGSRPKPLVQIGGGPIAWHIILDGVPRIYRFDLVGVAAIAGG